jgi:hypothetical protein
MNREWSRLRWEAVLSHCTDSPTLGLETEYLRITPKVDEKDTTGQLVGDNKIGLSEYKREGA